MIMGRKKPQFTQPLRNQNFIWNLSYMRLSAPLMERILSFLLTTYLTNRKVSEAELTLNVDDQAIKLVKAVNDTYQGNLSSPVGKKSLSITLSVKDKDVDDILITTYDPTDHDVLKIFRWWYWSLWLISSMTLIAMLFIVL